MVRVYFQIAAIAIHFLWLKVCVKMNHWILYYLNTLILQLSFSTFTILSNAENQREIYQ